MKKKVIALSLLIGAIALSSCIKEEAATIYLSTTPVSYAVTGAPGDVPAATETLNNTTFTWNPDNSTITIECNSGYGYVTNTWGAASSAGGAEVIATNSKGDSYTSTNWHITSGALGLTDASDNAYKQAIAYNDSDRFVCVPLSTDAQWAGN